MLADQLATALEDRGSEHVAAILLDKLATDNGFDKEDGRHGDWLAFSSTHSTLKIWLSSYAQKYSLAVSDAKVADGIGATKQLHFSTYPKGSVGGAVSAKTISALHPIVRKAFRISDRG